MNAAVDLVAWTLLHAVWIGVALAAAFAALQFTLGRDRHEFQHAAGVVALLLCVALPPAVTTWQFGGAGQRSPDSPAPSTTADSAPTDARNRVAPQPAVGTTSADALKVTPWPRVAVTAWAIGVTLLCLRHGIGFAAAQRLGRRGLTDHAVLAAERFQTLAGRMGLSRLPRLAASTLVPAPCVVGWVRPVVLIPIGLLRELTPPQLEAIVLHELAHLRRHDYAINLLQRLIETLLFFHPAVWWVSRRVRVHREFCCDRLVLAAQHNQPAYARALLTSAAYADASEKGHVMPTAERLATALTPAATDADLAARVERVIDPAAQARPPRTLAALALTSMLAMALLTATLGITACRSTDTKATATTEPRVVRVDWSALLAGDMRHNIVIRPGDTVVAEPVDDGLFYVAGKVTRPGAYRVPGPNRLTMKQAFVAAGGDLEEATSETSSLAALLIRRHGEEENPQELAYALLVNALFDGTSQDVFLGPDDLLNFSDAATLEAQGHAIEAAGDAAEPRPIRRLPTLVKRGLYPDAELVGAEDLQPHADEFPEEGAARFEVMGPADSTPKPGTYPIVTPNFRLLEAVAAAGGVPNGVETIYVIRATD